ncbi:glycosyltransferase family 2 protein, partial [Candidatus Daviesbacteria bacterium]|nr:glycosyltransferase family 2 protein [Candidatus Daviesbacteria bacterium]
MINLSIITVIFNNESSIKKYLQSLTKNLPERSEVILIDNASTDKTVEIIHSFNDKRIKLYGQSKNLGFSKGCNLGAKYAQGKYLLFLNSDIQIIDDGIKKLLEAKIENFKVALVAPKLILTNGHVQASIRKLPTLRGVFEEYFLGKKNSYQEYIPSGNESQVIECAYGAAMLLEKSFFEKVGGFDERYFLYYEDIELCRKIK